jgi:hypothetical protein
MSRLKSIFYWIAKYKYQARANLKMYIVPKSGLKIRDPITHQFLAEEGREVDSHSMYWHRIANDGDVTIVTDKPSEEGVE